MNEKRINLLTPEMRVELKPGKKKKKASCPPIYLAALAVVALCSLLCLNQKSKIAHLNKKLKAAQMEFVEIEDKMNAVQNRKKDVSAKAEGMDKENENMAGEIAFLRANMKKEAPWSDILMELNKCLPGKIWFDRVHLKKQSLTVGGTSLNNPLVSEFMERLNHSSYFSDARFTFTEKSTREEKDVIVFEITCNLVKAE